MHEAEKIAVELLLKQNSGVCQVTMTNTAYAVPTSAFGLLTGAVGGRSIANRTASWNL